MTMPDPAKLLRRTFMFNALSTAASGAAFVVGGGVLGPAFGQAPLVLRVLGGLFLALAVYMWLVARKEPIPRGEAAFLIANDAAYVVATAVVLLGWPELLRPAGRIVFALIGDAVAVMAVLQYVGFRRMGRAAALQAA